MVIFLILFFLIFAPKIGFIDLSILVPLVILFFAAAITPLSLRLNNIFIKMALMIAILLVYQILIQITYGTFSLEELARLIRSILTVLIVGVISLQREKIDSYILYAIVIHAVIVIIAANYHPINEALSNISEIHVIHEGRAAGLLAGFDISGTLNLIAILILITDKDSITGITQKTLLIFILTLSCYYISRVSLLLSLTLLLYNIIRDFFRKDTPTYLKYIIIIFSSYVFYEVFNLTLKIMAVTFSLDFVEVNSADYESIVSKNAVQNGDDFLWSAMWYFPESISGIFFGTGISELNSDIGYVDEIFRYGITGLFFAIFIHAYFIFYFLKRKKTHNHILVISIFTLMLILTLKNNYLFTRAIFPIFILLTSMNYKNQKNE
jgi:uncharacterized membrane protein